MAIKMRMPVRVTGVTLDKSSIILTTVGDTEQLTATISPSNAEDMAVTWSSSDTTVATVSTTGLVTCVSPGEATITVTTHDGGYTATCGVIDQSGWQPGANTLLYFPLTDDSTDVVNNVSMNATGTVSYSQPTGLDIKCATFNGSSYLYNSSISTSYLPQGTSNRTMSLWLNFTGSISSGYISICGYGNAAINKMFAILKSGGVPSNFSISQYGNQPSDLSGSLAPVQNTWYNLVTTYDGTNWKLYINGTLCVTWAYSISTTGGPIFLWNRHGGTEVCPAGYASNFIIEDVAWSSQDVSDYYDLTKGDYGIS